MAGIWDENIEWKDRMEGKEVEHAAGLLDGKEGMEGKITRPFER